MWSEWEQISAWKRKYGTGGLERSLCRDFFLLLFTYQGSMQMLDGSEALKSNIWSVKMVLSCFEFPILVYSLQSIHEECFGFKTRMGQILRRKKITVWYSTWNKYLYESVLKWLYTRHWIKGTSRKMFICSWLDKSIWRNSAWLEPLSVMVTFRPQGCTLRSDSWFSALVMLARAVPAPPSMPTCLACLPLEIFVCGEENWCLRS